MQRSFGERVAMNSPIQGAAADIIKIAMIRVNQRLKDQKMKSRLVLQVHDELLIEAYEPELDEVQNILKEEMEHAAELKVPLEIDMHTGDELVRSKIRGVKDMKIIGINRRSRFAGKTQILEYLNDKYGATICHDG